MRIYKYLFVLMVASLAVSSFGQNKVSPSDTQQGYMLGPGDVVTGKVLGEPQFDFVATVDADGKLEIPFVEKPIVAKCKTERDLRTEIAGYLSKYLRTPQVSIRVTERNSRPPVSVYGEVRKQEQYKLTRRVHLLELISLAGGETEKSGGMIQVFRTQLPICAESTESDWGPIGGDGLNVPHRIYSLAALRQGGEESNPEILPGDIIVVPKASPVYVTGEVLKPGEMSIPEGGLPLMQAVAMASGITRDAKTKEIKIYRRRVGATEPQVLVANYDLIRKGEQKDLMLEPFDIVEVGKSKKSIGDIFYEVLVGLPNRIPIPIRPL
ncbi:MAG: SLBB domain-containing protein [Pyrinomonadaceae bacterium]